jgi:hypothetical protein
MLSLRILACSSHKFSDKDGSSRPAPRRTQVRPTDIKRAIQHANNICYNFEDTQACRIAWDHVEELSSEMARHRLAHHPVDDPIDDDGA